MSYSVVIPSNRRDETIHYTLSSLLKQTIQPQTVFVVVDICFRNEKEREDYQSGLSLFTKQLSISFISQYTEAAFLPGRNNASYVRNTGIKKVTADFLLCVDDDNVFSENFAESLLSSYQEIEEGKDMLFVPTEKWRNTEVIRSQGYDRFNYFLGRVPPFRMKKKLAYQSIRFASSNCLWGPSSLFQRFLFDEEDIPFVYEDFDMTSRISNGGIPLYVLSSVCISHMMREKTDIEESYIGTKETAYQKGKNRVLFVKKNAGNREKFSYFCCGLRLHSLALFYKLRKSSLSQKKKREFSLSLMRGTLDGLKKRYYLTHDDL